MKNILKHLATLALASLSLKEVESNLNEAVECISKYNAANGTDVQLSDFIDLSSLPVFGEEPGDTTDVWSYDGDSVLLWGDDGKFYRETISDWLAIA